MASGWTGLASTLNDAFSNDNDMKKLAKAFKIKHGKKGDGADQFTTPYKLGHFVERHGGLLTSTAARGRFLIDSGSRRWDKSIELLEHTVKHSLTRVDSADHEAPKKITFNVIPDSSGKTTARAEITDANTGAPLTDLAAIESAAEYVITIICPPDSS